MAYTNNYFRYVSPENSYDDYHNHVDIHLFEVYDCEEKAKRTNDLRECFCLLSKTLSKLYFYKLSKFYFHGNDMDERGLTDLLIHEFSRLASFTRSSPVEVYKSKYESIYGSDIDLYYSPDGLKYYRFALQAKTLSPNGYYKHLTKVEGLRQIALLKAHQSKFGSMALYLSYCGYPDEEIVVTLDGTRQTNGNHKLFRDVVPSKVDYGLGLNSINEVETLVNTLSTANSRVHFFQMLGRMQGLHRLLCPKANVTKDNDRLGYFDNDDLRVYSKDEIFTDTHYVALGKSVKDKPKKDAEIVDEVEDVDEIVMSENSKYRIVYNAKYID